MKIFSEILNYNIDTIRTSLGEFGISLRKFSENLRLDHFGTSEVPITEDLSDKLCQMLCIVDYSLKNNFYQAISGIDKFFNKSVPVELKNLDKKFIRLSKDHQHRDFLRKTKKSYEISLINFYEKASVIWNNLPDDFSMYTRHSECYKDMIKNAEIKANRYKQLGCEELYLNIYNSIENIKKSIEQIYCGFHKISLRNASIILAKINGFKLNKKDDILSGKYEISLNKSAYSPKIYPLYYLESIFTDKIKELLVEIEDPCLFDHHIVLVPSTKSCSQEKDFENIKNKNIIPIVLGDKDGSCYFLSYWI